MKLFLHFFILCFVIIGFGQHNISYRTKPIHTISSSSNGTIVRPKLQCVSFRPTHLDFNSNGEPNSYIDTCWINIYGQRHAFLQESVLNEDNRSLHQIVLTSANNINFNTIELGEATILNVTDNMILFSFRVVEYRIEGDGKRHTYNRYVKPLWIAKRELAGVLTTH